MGQRNIQFNPHINDFQADQGHTHLHPEPCIVYTNLPNYPPQNINFRPIPERHDNNPMFYAMTPYNTVQHPQHNIDLNVAPPSGHHYINPYLTPPAGIQANNHGPHAISCVDPVGGPFKRKNAEGTSSGYPYQNAPVGPSSSAVAPAMDNTRLSEQDVSQTDPTANASFMPLHEPVVENGSLRSVRNRTGMVGPESGPERNANVIRGNYVPPLVQLPGNHPWLDMNYGVNSGDMGSIAWGQSPNLPYTHPNVTGACVETGGNMGVQGYQVGTTNRGGVGFVHQNPQHHPTLPPMQGGVRGYHLPHQLATSSHGMPMIRYSNNPFQDVLDTGPAFIAPVPPTGLSMYRAHHRGEIMLDPNARHHLGFPAHLRVLPEHEVAMLEIPGYHVAGESMDQHRDMRLDIDHMSYEELLALGEQIGSVGSGLSEEFIQKYLKVKTFAPGPTCINLEVAPCPDQELINFCIVCQMDYENGESVGVLECGHEYHRDCIKKWLVVKNSCPVCKSTALRGKGKDLAIDGR